MKFKAAQGPVCADDTHSLSEHVPDLIYFEDGDLLLVQLPVHALHHRRVGAQGARYQKDVWLTALQYEVLATETVKYTSNLTRLLNYY